MTARPVELPQRPRHRSIRLRRADAGELSAPARARRGRRETLAGRDGVRLRAAGRRGAGERAPDRLHCAGAARARPAAEATLAGFSAEFLAGMSSEASRSRRLGDTGTSAPSAWRWGYGDRVPDAVLMLFARNGLDESARRVRERLGHGVRRHRDARHDGHRHARAVRVRRRHQPANTGLGAARRSCARVDVVSQRYRARRVSARLSQRVRSIHGPPAVDGRPGGRGDAAARRGRARTSATSA